MLTPELLAEIVLASAKLREESYDHEASNKAVKKDKKSGVYGYIDFKQFYTKTLNEAIEETVIGYGIDKRFARYISLSFYWWNDVLDWANEIKKEEKKDEKTDPVVDNTDSAVKWINKCYS